MFTVQVDDTKIQIQLDNAPSKVREKLETAIYALAQKLRNHVIQDKLLGQVLNRVSGRLGQSIQQEVESSGNSVVGRVYSSGDVPYARIHEYGGVTAPHVIEAKNAQALAFSWNGKDVFFKKVNHPGSRMPERSYMRSSLADMKDEITQGMTIAVKEGLQ